MTTVPYSATDTTITVVIGFAPRVVAKSHPNFDQILEALQSGTATEEELEPLLSIPKAIEAFTDGDVLVKDGKLFYKGFEVKTKLANLILQFSRDGKEAAAAPFKAFLSKAHANPDPRAQTDLYEWVVASGLPITPDGDILAWKAVRQDYGSIHSGGLKFDHHVGNFVEEDRTTCDPDPNRTCSRGLHFCSGPYLKNYGGGGSRIVAVKISPTDVVAFPTDYGWEKGRACRYQVVGEVPTNEVKDFYPQGRRIYSGFETVAAPAVKAAPVQKRAAPVRVRSATLVPSPQQAAAARIVPTGTGKFDLRHGRKSLGIYARQRDARRGAARRGLSVK